jgi:hypothetical protein
MTRWTVDAPTALDFDEATELNVRLIGGTVAMLASDDRQLRLQSTSGAIRTEFETLGTVKAPASHTVSGNVGAGTGRVSVTTMSGAVTLLRRAAVTTGGLEPPSPPVAGMESKTQ